MIARRLVVDDGRTRRDVPLTGTVVIGRDPSCEVSEADPLLSRRHVEFVTDGSAITVRDLGSRNGILVNGEKVREQKLAPGDLVQAGRLQLLYIEETAAAPPPVPPAAPVPPPAATVMLPAGSVAMTDDLAALLDGPRPVLKPMLTGDEPTFMSSSRPGASSPSLDDTAPAGKFTPDDIDATRALPRLSSEDLDATGLVTRFSPGDLDATALVTRAGLAEAMGDDEPTMLVWRTPVAAPQKPLAAGEARLVTGPSLIVSEAAAAGENLFGMTPQSLVGTSIPDLVVRALGLMVAGEGPASVSLRAERRQDGHVTITFTTEASIEK